MYNTSIAFQISINYWEYVDGVEIPCSEENVASERLVLWNIGKAACVSLGVFRMASISFNPLLAIGRLFVYSVSLFRVSASRDELWPSVSSLTD